LSAQDFDSAMLELDQLADDWPSKPEEGDFLTKRLNQVHISLRDTK